MNRKSQRIKFTSPPPSAQQITSASTSHLDNTEGSIVHMHNDCLRIESRAEGEDGTVRPKILGEQNG